ncbi:MAG: ATP-binding protein [Pseudomonadota bacterium]
MSSTRPSILRSTVFTRVIWACAAFVTVAMTLLWAICGSMVLRRDAAQEARILEAIEYTQEVYYRRGSDALIDEEIVENGAALWEEDFIYEVLEQEAQLIVLRDAEYDPIAGYHGLYADIGWQITYLDHPDIDQPVRAYLEVLRGGETITIAEFLPERRAAILELAWGISFALILIVLPLALITGYFLSRSVFNRIEGISQTAAAVAAGQMTSRVPQSDRYDEFDRLAGGINEMLDRLAALNANIEAVSVGVAHDLRTPLTNIGGRLELISRDRANPDAVEKHIEAAEGYLSQLLGIFDALLRLGEVEAGRRKAAFDVVDLSALAADMAEAYAPIFEDANKSFQAHIDPGARISGDRELLEQLVANLLENAVEHARDAAQVGLSVRITADTVTLAISDDGPGISPANRTRIFERFYRADASRSTPGNGLGLSLVKAIADLHGADITLDEDAPGAVFTLVFPRQH